jgi:hypothetical protein
MWYLGRLAVLSATMVSLDAAPSGAANCFWSGGALKCYNRSGSVSAAKPRMDWDRQNRPSGDGRRLTVPYGRDPAASGCSYSYFCN